jgi:hypothetical protein
MQNVNSPDDKREKLDGDRASGVYDFLPQVMWTRNFLEALAYGMSDTVI